MRTPRGVSTMNGQRTIACIACQKHKVRCMMEDGSPPCQRCQRRRVTCTPRKRTLPEGAEDLGAALTHDIKMIYAAINDLHRAASKPLLPPLHSTAPPVASDNGTRTPESLGMDHDMVEEDSWSSTAQTHIDCTPISSLYEITKLKSLRPNQIPLDVTEANTTAQGHNDIISKGLIELSEADKLVRNYLERSNNYVFEIASKHKDLESIRRGSPLLLVAICTVSALQDATATRLYRICHDELRRLIFDFIFTPILNLEDLRGLVIASFWLSDISWTVSGLVIRRALDVELQNSFAIVATARDPDMDPTAAAKFDQEFEAGVERMKLWYLLYFCDQHLSILYARTPMLGNQECIRNFEKYLSTASESVYRQRIMSQVALLRILSAVSDLLGTESNTRIPTIFKPQIDNFSRQVDAWATKWLNCYSQHQTIGNYPIKAVSMHYQFAKLLISSHVFRGLTHDGTVDPIPPEFLETANNAVHCAKAIILLVIQDTDLKSAIVGLPHYFHSMIAYACAFLIKTFTLYRDQVTVEADQTREMIEQVIQLCESSNCGQHHLVRWIGKGLRILLINCLSPQPDPLPGTLDGTTHPPETPYPSGTTPHFYDLHNIPTTSKDPSFIWNAAREATFINPHDQAQYGNTVGLFSQPYGESPSSGDLANPFPLTGPEAHMEHFALGLGLLR